MQSQLYVVTFVTNESVGCLIQLLLLCGWALALHKCLQWWYGSMLPGRSGRRAYPVPRFLCKFTTCTFAMRIISSNFMSVLSCHWSFVCVCIYIHSFVARGQAVFFPGVRSLTLLTKICVQFYVRTILCMPVCVPSRYLAAATQIFNPTPFQFHL
jgi:hypothetical protein